GAGPPGRRDRQADPAVRRAGAGLPDRDHRPGDPPVDRASAPRRRPRRRGDGRRPGPPRPLLRHLPPGGRLRAGGGQPRRARRRRRADRQGAAVERPRARRAGRAGRPRAAGALRRAALPPPGAAPARRRLPRRRRRPVPGSRRPRRAARRPAVADPLPPADPPRGGGRDRHHPRLPRGGDRAPGRRRPAAAAARGRDLHLGGAAGRRAAVRRRRARPRHRRRARLGARGGAAVTAGPAPLVVIDAVGLTPSMLGPDTPHLSALALDGFRAQLDPILPAVTCSAQATLLTGALPREHGVVGNGWYFRDLAEVLFWRQSNHVVGGDKLWDAARRARPDLRTAVLLWWFNMYSSAELSVTVRPIYPADGRKIPALYSHPSGLAASLEAELGRFPFFQFWGPSAGLPSSDWIARAALELFRRERPGLTLVYLPHLD